MKEFKISDKITLHLGNTKPVFPEDDRERIEWTSALRSGKYKQNTVGVLKTAKEKYCCLGVKRDLEGAKWTFVRYNNSIFEDENSQISGYLGSAEWINPLGRFPKGTYANRNNYKYKALAYCNDAGFTFNEIADIIDIIWDKKNWE